VKLKFTFDCNVESNLVTKIKLNRRWLRKTKQKTTPPNLDFTGFPIHIDKLEFFKCAYNVTAKLSKNTKIMY